MAIGEGVTMFVSSWCEYLGGCLRGGFGRASQKCLLGNASGFCHICFV